jgi:hypothetical protein
MLVKLIEILMRTLTPTNDELKLIETVADAFTLKE